jgi:hypothetical protein
MSPVIIIMIRFLADEHFHKIENSVGREIFRDAIHATTSLAG